MDNNHINSSSSGRVKKKKKLSALPLNISEAAISEDDIGVFSVEEEEQIVDVDKLKKMIQIESQRSAIFFLKNISSPALPIEEEVYLDSFSAKFFQSVGLDFDKKNIGDVFHGKVKDIKQRIREAVETLFRVLLNNNLSEFQVCYCFYY